jgi:hypothetical protein
MNFVENSLVPLIGGLFVIASFTGFGYLVRRILGAQDECPIAEATALGLGGFILVGGFLNLIDAVTLFTILLMESIGILGLLLHRRQICEVGRNCVNDRACQIVFLVLSFVYLRSVCSASFSVSDDLVGYLEPVAKLVQTGGLGQEPFLVQRLMIGVGAYFFLEAIFVAQFGFFQISMLEPGLGMLIGVLAVASYLKQANASWSVVTTAAIAVTAALAITSPTATGPVFQAGLLIVLILKLLSGQVRGFPEATSVGLLIGAVLSLKIIIAPFVAFLMFAWLASEAMFHRDWWRLASDTAVIALTSLVVLGPWMINLYLSSGTPLFPVLGIGYWVRDVVPLPMDGATWQLVMQVPLLLRRHSFAIALLTVFVIVTYIRLQRKSASDHLMLAIALFNIPLLVTIDFITGTDMHSLRYMQTVYVPVAASEIAWIYGRTDVGQRCDVHRVKRLAGIALLLLFAVLLSSAPREFAIRSYLNLVQLVKADEDFTRRLENSVSVALFDDAQRQAFQRAQDAAAPGSTVLVSLERPYLLNFKRNIIWNAGNYGGNASPAPGFPIDATGRDINDYLSGAGVDYVLFQHAGPEGWLDDYKKGVAESAHFDSWCDAQVATAVKFRDALQRLMRSGGTVVYSDDRFATVKINGSR